MPPSHAPTKSQAAAEPSRMNWAGNLQYNANAFAQPGSVESVRQLVGGADHLKAVGSRHSFNDIADTQGTQLSLAAMKSMSLDVPNRRVTVDAGVTYGELAPWLHARSFALHNMASLPHISIAGACATGTHGSGIRNRCLTAAVCSMEMITGTGDTLTLTREDHPKEFHLAALGLGAFGIVTRLTLGLVPTYEVAQMVYQDLGFDQLQHSFREIFSAGYSVSLFTDWQEHRATQAWVKRKLHDAGRGDFGERFYGATMQRTKLHPLPNMSAESCTEQEGIPGAWYERLPHFRMDYTPSAGAELQTEYFVSIEHGYDAMVAVETLRDVLAPHLLVSELRVVAADQLPMSMCFGRESLALHFTWKREVEAVRAVLPRIEALLAPFGARPHWAKLFTVPPATVRTLYSHLDDFKALAKKYDPERRFANLYLNELFGL